MNQKFSRLPNNDYKIASQMTKLNLDMNINKLIKQRSAERLMQNRRHKYYYMKPYSNFDEDLKTNELLLNVDKFSNTRTVHQCYYLSRLIKKIQKVDISNK